MLRNIFCCGFCRNKSHESSDTKGKISTSTAPSSRNEYINPAFDDFQTISVIALYSYNARCHDELSFLEGDEMELYCKDIESSEEPAWIKAKLKKNPSLEGMIPINYVTRVINNLEQFKWFFGDINRVEADRYLKSSSKDTVTFLVRNSSNNGCSYAISVGSPNGQVKHFLIKGNEGHGYFLTEQSKFISVPELIKHYSSVPLNGFLLNKACQRSETPETYGLTYEIADKWEVDRSLLEKKLPLGKGNFGEVFFGIFNGVTQVAIKQLKELDESLDEFKKEVMALKKLHHRNIVQLYGVCTQDRPYWIITEYLEKGDLQNYLRKGFGQYLTIDELIDSAADVASGMAYLESRNYVHRDLAARNVLVGKAGNCKVADLGMARSVLADDDVYEPPSPNRTKIPIKWSAPEVLQKLKFSHKSDVWSFGICLFEIIEKGAKPYFGLVNPEVQQLVCSGKTMGFGSMQNCPMELFEMMLSCWKFEPEDRPTFSSLLQNLNEFYSNPYDSVDKNSKSLVIDGPYYQRFCMLNDGGFGQIHKGSWKKKTQVAMRIIDEKPNNFGKFVDEVSKIKLFKNENLIQFHGHLVEDEKTVLFYEFAYNGNLLNYLKRVNKRTNFGNDKKEESDLSPQLIYNIAGQIASGMAYLEKNDFIHGNLSAKNVLLGRNNQCKLASYELYSLSQYFHSLTTFTKTIKWKAPETWAYERSSTIKSDVWSFGVCLLEIVEKGKEPLQGLSDEDARTKIMLESYVTFEELAYCPGKIFSIMERCWNKNPQQRPSFADLREALQI